MDVNDDGKPIPGQEGRIAKGRVLRDVTTVGFTQSDLGDGEVKAVTVRDSVCVGAGGSDGGEACVDMALLGAVHMDDKPFACMPNDGIVGLGLQGLAAGPTMSFLGRLFEGSTGVLPQFGIALAGPRGELHLGGHNSAHLAAPLRWFSVDHPEQGYWQVAIQEVRVGNLTVDACHQGCHGIIDTSVSRLGVQTGRLPAIMKGLASTKIAQGPCQGPELTFDLGGMMLKMGPREYAGMDCSPRLGSLDLPEPEFIGIYALGGALLQRYYTAFDWEQRRLGFAPLARTGSEHVVLASSGESVAEEPAGVLLV